MAPSSSPTCSASTPWWPWPSTCASPTAIASTCTTRCAPTCRRVVWAPRPGRASMSTGPELEAGALLERYTLKAFVEACLILEDGVASAKDIDFAMVAGAGGAPPLASADQAGLDAMVPRLEAAARGGGGASVRPPSC